jgi:hypothetical protein
MNRSRRAYIADDSYYALDQAVCWLAQMRGLTDPPPAPTTPISPPDLLHLLASLALQAGTWMFHTIEDLHHHEDGIDIDPEDLEHILAGARPEFAASTDT